MQKPRLKNLSLSASKKSTNFLAADFFHFF